MFRLNANSKVQFVLNVIHTDMIRTKLIHNPSLCPYIVIIFIIFLFVLETRSALKMRRVSHHRPLWMSGKSAGWGQMQGKLQRRRRATVQRAQNGQTPLDAQANAKGQVFALRKGQSNGTRSGVEVFWKEGSKF